MTPAAFAAMLLAVRPGVNVVGALVALVVLASPSTSAAEPADAAPAPSAPESPDSPDSPESPDSPDSPEEAVVAAHNPHLALGAGGHVAFGTAPATAVGARVSAEIITGGWSLGIEGRYDLSASRMSSAAREAARSALVGGSFVPCMRSRHGWACGVVLASRVTVDGAGAHDAWFFVGIGARLESHFPMPFDFALRIAVELLAHPIPYELEADGHRIFRSSVVSALIGPTLVHAF